MLLAIPNFTAGSLPGYSAAHVSGVALNPYNLVDGNVSTYYSYGGNNTSTAGSGSVIYFDAIKKITKISFNVNNVGYAFDSGSGQHYSPNTTISFSTDGGATFGASQVFNNTGGGGT
jgi:hypothetical protein